MWRAQSSCPRSCRCVRVCVCVSWRSDCPFCLHDVWFLNHMHNALRSVPCPVAFHFYSLSKSSEQTVWPYLFCACGVLAEALLIGSCYTMVNKLFMHTCTRVCTHAHAYAHTHTHTHKCASTHTQCKHMWKSYSPIVRLVPLAHSQGLLPCIGMTCQALLIVSVWHIHVLLN